ncbi:MAG: aminomethyltransferase family protein [Alphaproteobacteria bacterium]|nr:aminomethyltransferase family protein [Alphaproteobacteria bacterium]
MTVNPAPLSPAYVRATPFHTRAAAANEGNAWVARNGATLARQYADARDEVLAARFRVGLIDISWRWRLMLEGTRAAECLSQVMTRDVSALAPGEALKALWLGDDGRVRGAGVAARFGKERFVLISAQSDAPWIEAAARRFAVAVCQISEAEGGLALVGPYAAATLERAGLDSALEPGRFRKLFWRGQEVTLSRFGEHGGYEIWCAADDGILLWDRLMRAGEPFGIEPLGMIAADALDLETGIARPGRDWRSPQPGRNHGFSPLALGLESLIDENHTLFNGRAMWLAGRDGETRRLAGIQIDGETPAPYTPLMRSGAAIGQTLSSAYSPALRRAIALALVDVSAAAPGTELKLTLSPSLEVPEFREAAVRVTALPFLPAPEPAVL